MIPIKVDEDLPKAILQLMLLRPDVDGIRPLVELLQLQEHYPDRLSLETDADLIIQRALEFRHLGGSPLAVCHL